MNPTSSILSVCNMQFLTSDFIVTNNMDETIEFVKSLYYTEKLYMEVKFFLWWLNENKIIVVFVGATTLIWTTQF
jgi:hypothetical protein